MLMPQASRSELRHFSLRKLPPARLLRAKRATARTGEPASPASWGPCVPVPSDSREKTAASRTAPNGSADTEGRAEWTARDTSARARRATRATAARPGPTDTPADTLPSRRAQFLSRRRILSPTDTH